MTRRRRKLTEAEWSDVFQICCRAKQGLPLSKADRVLIDAAFNEDPDRYAKMELDVFDATVPFGSNVRARRQVPP